MVLNEIEVLHKATPSTIEQNKIEVMVEEENGAIETSTNQHTSDRKTGTILQQIRRKYYKRLTKQPALSGEPVRNGTS